MQVCHALLQPAAQGDTQTGTTSRNLSSLEDTGGGATPSQPEATPGMHFLQPRAPLAAVPHTCASAALIVSSRPECGTQGILALTLSVSEVMGLVCPARSHPLLLAAALPPRQCCRGCVLTWGRGGASAGVSALVCICQTVSSGAHHRQAIQQDSVRAACEIKQG